MFKSVFLSHPRSVGETYLEHQGVALSFAGELMVAGLACAVHAFIPALFPRAASQKIERLYLRLNVKRHANSPNRRIRKPRRSKG
jgi:hypothetical protein